MATFVAVVAVVALATPLVFCLGPLANTLRSALGTLLRGEGRTATEGRQQRFIMSAAVVAQFSLAFLLLTTAGLLARSLVKSTKANPGFRPEHVISARLALPSAAYKTPGEIHDLFHRLLDRLSTLPGVRQTGAISNLPIGSTSNVVISIEDRAGVTETVDMLFCQGSALESLGVSLLRGRLLQPRDESSKVPVAVVSEALARQTWPNENPLGRRIRFGVDVPDNHDPWLTVVGVVADVKAHLTSESPRLLMFTPPQDWINQMNVVVRTSGDPLLLARSIRGEIAGIDPNLPVQKMETLDQVLQESLSAERFRTWLLVCFALAALLLATLGIAGLLAYNAAQRTQEFGVRIAMGANRRDLLTLVLRHCLRLCGMGIVVGLAASIAVTRAISAMLYETSPLDPGTFTAVPLILIVVALGAAMIPAWPVVRTNPIAALRGD